MSIGPHKSVQVYVTVTEITEGSFPVCLIPFLNKFNLKNTKWCVAVRKQCTGQIKTARSVAFYVGLFQKLSQFFE